MCRHTIAGGVADYTSYNQTIYTLLGKVYELYKSIKQIAATNQAELKLVAPV